MGEPGTGGREPLCLYLEIKPWQFKPQPTPVLTKLCRSTRTISNDLQQVMPAMVFKSKAVKMIRISFCCLQHLQIFSVYFSNIHIVKDRWWHLRLSRQSRLAFGLICCLHLQGERAKTIDLCFTEVLVTRTYGVTAH